MPLYTYGCGAGHEFEVEQRITDAPLTVCEIAKRLAGNTERGECLAPCRRLINAPAFILKGGGWYRDGYSGGSK